MIENFLEANETVFGKLVGTMCIHAATFRVTPASKSTQPDGGVLAQNELVVADFGFELPNSVPVSLRRETSEGGCTRPPLL